MGTVFLRTTTAPDGTYQNLGTTLTQGQLDNNMTLFLRNDVSDSMSGNLTINGSLTATTKSFTIKHPLQEGMLLVYGSLEGPEHGAYIRGRLVGNDVIVLPDYWTKLVDPASITVQLTSIGQQQNLYVVAVQDNRVYVASDSVATGQINCFYFVQAERVDVEKLQVEVEANVDSV